MPQCELVAGLWLALSTHCATLSWLRHGWWFGWLVCWLAGWLACCLASWLVLVLVLWMLLLWFFVLEKSEMQSHAYFCSFCCAECIAKHSTLHTSSFYPPCDFMIPVEWGLTFTECWTVWGCVGLGWAGMGWAEPVLVGMGWTGLD